MNNLKEFWKINRNKLGDMAENKNACKALTMTYNNMGVINKKEGKRSQAIKYLKMVLEIEEEM